MRGHPDQQLMQQPREHKHHRAREPAAEAPAHERGVDVPPHEVIHGFVPRAPVVPHARAVPPLGVEFAVAEAHNLREGVQQALEDGEEAGEPDDEGDGGEFHEALGDGGDVHGGDFREGVVQQGRGVLGAGEPDEDAEAGAFGDAFGDKGPADGGGARVDGLVDQGGGPPEVGEVADGDVLGIWALGVEFW